jgi:hypothetical protein
MRHIRHGRVSNSHYLGPRWRSILGRHVRLNGCWWGIISNVLNSRLETTKVSHECIVWAFKVEEVCCRSLTTPPLFHVKT